MSLEHDVGECMPTMAIMNPDNRWVSDVLDVRRRVVAIVYGDSEVEAYRSARLCAAALSGRAVIIPEPCVLH